ncbi:hypothetical protein [Sphingomonas oligoaromativorans]|nr:hypothetical protein [Sphingomonas oligoaromativorans]NIJ31954.1 hypothetical protein [Sphingomonas oligoaromativorans]
MTLKIVAGVLLLAFGLHMMVGAATGPMLIGVALILWAVRDMRSIRQ